MNTRQLLIAIWFFSMVGILFVNTYIFYLMMKSPQQLFFVYEQNKKLLYAESINLVILMSITLWLLYRYLIKQNYMDIIKENHDKY